MLAIEARRNQSTATILDVRDLAFIDKVLVGWGVWARNDGIDLRPTAAGDLWQIQAIIEGRAFSFVLTDDAFLLVDQRVAIVERRYHDILMLEYFKRLSPAERLRQCALERTAYSVRLKAAQSSVYRGLDVALDNWRQKSVKLAPLLKPTAKQADYPNP